VNYPCHWYNAIGLFLENNPVIEISPDSVYDIVGLNIDNIRYHNILQVREVMNQLGWVPIYGIPSCASPGEFVYRKVFNEVFFLVSKELSMDNTRVDIDANTVDADLVNDFLVAKTRNDTTKAAYDAARKKLLARFAHNCECNSREKVGLDLHVENLVKVVRIDPTVKFSVVDFDALPPSVKPFVVVTETVTLTPAGKKHLEEFLTSTYGAVELEESEEYFDSIGLTTSVVKKITVK